ncbi:MAG: hypothetical protein ACK4OE_19605 [Acidovorax sp.]|uniref:hypothetical protein n=1 Tax=Acidovorax sp. TaxID=1872122 RepID=UPI00391C4CD3
MATSSLLGIDADNRPPAHSATGIDSLGPSDASDSGSDSAGAYGTESESDTDRFGTGERSSVDPAPEPTDTDILPDHVDLLGADADDALPTETGPVSADRLPQESADETADDEPDA